MDDMIETDMTNWLKREVEEFIEQLASRGFAIDEMDLVVTFHYEIDGVQHQEQRRVQLPESNSPE